MKDKKHAVFCLLKGRICLSRGQNCLSRYQKCLSPLLFMRHPRGSFSFSLYVMRGLHTLATLKTSFNSPPKGGELIPPSLHFVSAIAVPAAACWRLPGCGPAAPLPPWELRSPRRRRAGSPLPWFYGVGRVGIDASNVRPEGTNSLGRVPGRQAGRGAARPP